MKIPKIYRRSLYISMSLLFLTGLVAWIAYLGISPETETTGLLYLIRSTGLKIHGGMAMIVLIVLGALIPNHIVKSWKIKKNKPSGTILVSVLVVLILTGYFLYYSDEVLRNISSMIHIALGLLFPVFLVGHILSSRTYRHKKKNPRI
ncbi:MAG: hypothetical protein HYS07_00095 [Chlamydiae bacterium]|nr:hypothetical protein [Chlamydiota bacterium]MBI3276308.1 hypothetical protein [Chlamydiota bacterium]